MKITENVFKNDKAFGVDLSNSTPKAAKKAQQQKSVVSFVQKRKPDAIHIAGPVKAGRNHNSIAMNHFPTNDKDLIRLYRQASLQPIVAKAVEHIANEFITVTTEGRVVDVDLSSTGLNENVKKKIREEFDQVAHLLNLATDAHDLITEYFIDGRLAFHIVVDPENEKDGIIELVQVDPTSLHLIVEEEDVVDPATGIVMSRKGDEYYVYSPSITDLTRRSSPVQFKVHKDAIAYVTSGLTDVDKRSTISYLHRAMPFVNKLQIMEDSLVIYRMTRAPERRIFRLACDGMSPKQAMEYVEQTATDYRKDVQFDSMTGQTTDGLAYREMQEDFFVPTFGGGRGTEISTLSGGQNLGQIEDVEYFERKVFQSLPVPMNRLDPQSRFSFGQENNITYEEVHFQKFISRLHRRFAALLKQILKTQLVLKNIVTLEDWEDFSDFVVFNFHRDSYFTELKEAELWGKRVGQLRDFESHIGKYFSHNWVRRNLLKQSDDEQEQMTKEIMEEKKNSLYNDGEENGSGGGRGRW